MVTVATLEVSDPAAAWKVKLSNPTKLLVGVYVKEPSEFNVNVPLAGPPANMAVKLPPFAPAVALVSTPAQPPTMALPPV